MAAIDDQLPVTVGAGIIGLAYLWTWIYINASRQRLVRRIAHILTEP